MIDIAAFIEQMQALRAPQKAINHAVRIIQEVEAAKAEAATLERAQLAERRLADAARQQARRQRLRAQPFDPAEKSASDPASRDNHVMSQTASRDNPVTVTGQSQDPAPSPSLPPVPHPSRTPTHALSPAHTRPSLETAKGWNECGNPIPIETVELWWNTRERDDWQKANAAGTMTPVLLGKERNDLAAFHISHKSRQHERQQPQPRSSYTGKGTAFTTASVEARHAPENLTRPENRPPRAQPAPEAGQP